MKAMILAAGQGERMRPLTEHTPKPLLTVAGKPLIEYHLERLRAAGITDVVINIAWLGEKIIDALGDGSRWGLHIQYSKEPEPLETAGAINYALPLLGDQPFLLINGDIWTDYPFAELCEKRLLPSVLGHLILVENPSHHPAGDFSINNDFLVNKNSTAFTFSGISLLSPDLIAQYPNTRDCFGLAEVFHFFLQQKQLTADVYSGQWSDIGTIERLQEANDFVCQNK